MFTDKTLVLMMLFYSEIRRTFSPVLSSPGLQDQWACGNALKACGKDDKIKKNVWVQDQAGRLKRPAVY